MTIFEFDKFENQVYLLRWPVTGVFIVNETLNETRRNTQKLFSHHEETVLQSCSTSSRRRFVPREELKQCKYASTEQRRPPIADTWITIVIRPYLQSDRKITPPGGVIQNPGVGLNAVREHELILWRDRRRTVTWSRPWSTNEFRLGSREKYDGEAGEEHTHVGAVSQPRFGSTVRDRGAAPLRV